MKGKDFERGFRWLSLVLSWVNTRTEAGGAQATVLEGPTMLGMQRSHPTSSKARQSRDEGENRPWTGISTYTSHSHRPSVVPIVSVRDERHRYNKRDQ